MEALLQAIKTCGGQALLAEKLESKAGRTLKQPAIANWIRRGQVPPEWCLLIEEVSGVSRYQLRPDIFGEGEADGKNNHSRRHID